MLVAEGMSGEVDNKEGGENVRVDVVVAKGTGTFSVNAWSS